MLLKKKSGSEKHWNSFSSALQNEQPPSSDIENLYISTSDIEFGQQVYLFAYIINIFIHIFEGSAKKLLSLKSSFFPHYIL